MRCINLKKLINPLLSIILLGVMAAPVFADPIWIDVRTQEEHNEDSISGDMHMPMNVINPESVAEIYGKNAELNFYCRSGGRAGQVVSMLKEAGFTNVNNVGGIDDAREMRDIEETK